MGNSASINIDITSKPYNGTTARAGKTLKGNAVLQIDRPVKMENYTVDITFQGVERAEIHDNKFLTSTFREKGASERDLYCKTIQLTKQGKAEFAAGTYTFPFKFRLPSNLPASSEYRSTRPRKSGFEIAYKLTAAVGPKVVCEKVISLASSNRNLKCVPSYVAPVAYPISGFRCQQRGWVTIGAKILTNQVNKGQYLTVFIAGRNDSPVDLRKIEVQLVENLIWTTGQHTQTARSVIARVAVADLRGMERERPSRSPTRNNKSRSGVSPSRGRNESRSPSPQRKTPVVPQTVPADAKIAVQRELEEEISFVVLHVPFFARETYKGPLVEIRHSIEVVPDTGALVSQTPLRIAVTLQGTTASASTSKKESFRHCSVPSSPLSIDRSRSFDNLCLERCSSPTRHEETTTSDRENDDELLFPQGFQSKSDLRFNAAGRAILAQPMKVFPRPFDFPSA